MKKHIQIIIGSVRLGRIGPQIAKWAKDNLEDHFSCELIDLKEWVLPMDDEPGLPADGTYVHDHTRQWSKKIADGDAFIFVFPQYNWGYPAALKNAIDHLYHEWSNKPAFMISYANKGGGKAASQLRQVLNGVHINVCNNQVEIKLSDIDLTKLNDMKTYPKDLQYFDESLNTTITELTEMFSNQQFNHGN